MWVISNGEGNKDDLFLFRPAGAYMRKIFYPIVLLVYLIMPLLTSECFHKETFVLNPKSPTVVTLWHSYNAYAKKELDRLVLEFNETVGVERGIIIDEYGYGDAEKLETAIYNAANKIIGSDPMPNIFAAYPDSAYQVNQLTPLVALNTYFNEKDFAGYRPEFLAEGIWDGNLSPKMIPVAKSTEILYLNQTDWEKFMQATGTTNELLTTWEGLLIAAEKYFVWSGGKAMLGFNPFNGFIALTAAQLGVEPYSIDGDKVSFRYDRAIAKKIWDICYVPHIKGWYKSDSYGSDGIKSGNLIAYLGSSAGAGYFPTEVMVDISTTYPIECVVFPYPTFKNAVKYMEQRGANMCITTSDQPHEYAAAEFLKWFTSPERNMKFAFSTGYIPVKNESLLKIEEALSFARETKNNEAMKRSITITLDSMKKDKFYSPKSFNSSYIVHDILYTSIFKKITKDLKALELRVKNGENRETVISDLKREDNFEAWYDALSREVSNHLS